MISNLMGLEIIVNPLGETYKQEQVRFPRSKKRRIRKKWSKCARNFRSVHEPSFYRIGNRLICGPRSLAVLNAACESGTP